MTLAVRRSPAGTAGAAVLVALVLAAIVAPLWMLSPTAIDVVARLLPPSAAHPLGTDNLGRDILSRVVSGARISLSVGFAVMLCSTLVGAVSGAIAGYFTRLDALIMRTLDGLMAFPALLLAIALVAALGAGAVAEIVALSIVFWPRTARIVRAATLSVRTRLYIEAAVAMGANDATILLRHVLPNAAAPLIVAATFVYAESIMADAALSFLGLGVAPPAPTWGNMLGDARTYLTNAPWFAFFPGIAIVAAVGALNVIGEALRDALDPRAARRS